MNLIPEDTTLEAYRYQIEVLRRLGPEGRFKLCLEASGNLRFIANTGVRMRHPEYSDQEVSWAVTRLMMGEIAFKETFPWSQIKP